MPFTVIFSLSLDNELLGVCGYNEYANVIYLHSLVIAKAYLQKGYARPLCEYATFFSKKKGKYLLIGVSVDDRPWIFEFYKTFGFIFVSEGDPRFQSCLEYKFPWLFSFATLRQWMARMPESF